MRPSRFTEEQIIGMPKEQEAGARTVDVCRKHDISSATFYRCCQTNQNSLRKCPTLALIRQRKGGATP